MENNLSTDNKDRGNLILYATKKGNKGEEVSSNGRISNALSGAISYERDSSLFDTEEIKQRDKEVKELLELKQGDSFLGIDRKNKPVYLTNIQTRIIYALSYMLSLETDKEDIKSKINNPLRNPQQVIRTIDINGLSKFLFGSSRERNRKQILNELYNISHIRQVQIIGKGEKRYKFTAPFISLGETLEELTPSDKPLDVVNVTFGAAFFYELDKRFSVITPQLFEIWGKNGTGTELFSILLSSILSVYWHFRRAADEAEKRIKKEIRNYKKISEEEYRQKIMEGRQEALSYSLNVSSIKARVTTDYSSEKFYRAKFWKDLDNAAKGLIKIDLLTGYERDKGAKGQEKVIFHLSDTYNFSEKLIEQKPILNALPPQQDEDTINPF